VILLLGFMLMFSITLVQQMTAYVIDNGHQLSEKDIIAINEKYGSVQKGIFDLMSCTTGGHDWGETWQIIKKAGPFACGCFLAYIGIVGLAVTNVITSIFVDKAMRSAVPDLHKQIIERRREDLTLVSELQDLFQQMDSDSSNTISKAELMDSLSNIKVSSFFELKGLDIRDAETFFDVLEAGCGDTEIDMDTFVRGFLCMKGPANHVDVVTLTSRIQKMQRTMNLQLGQLQQDIARQFEACRRLMSHIRSGEDNRMNSTSHRPTMIRL